MLEIAVSIVLVTLLFGFTIFIHELGHFLVARWCGMTVDAFAIGMGPALWKRTVNGVEYKLCAFPIGGYVALPQMDPSGSPGLSEDGASRNLPRATPLAKILVGLAGVTFNMIFAFVLAYVIFWQGKAHAPSYESSAVGYVEADSAAYAAGLRPGDSIRSVNGEAVSTWEEFIVVAALSEAVELEIARPDGTSYTAALPTEKVTGGRLVSGLYAKNYCIVLDLLPDSPARAAGLAVGDRITAIDGEDLFSREQMIQRIDAAAGRSVTLTVVRGEETLSLAITPAFNEEAGRAMIGIAFRTDEVKRPLAQIKSHATLIFRILKALVTPSESRAAAQAIGGPVAIIDIFIKFAAVGLMQALWFACLLNVNLAVMNLLPLPVLDGGHILFALIESVTRRPAPAKLVNLLWKASAIFLLTIFVLLTFRDISRIVGGGIGSKPPPAEAAPADPTAPAEPVATP
jgi:regulator of sigma E protease